MIFIDNLHSEGHSDRGILSPGTPAGFIKAYIK